MIISPVKAIDNIRWQKVTSRAAKAEAVVVVPDGGRNDLMIARLANGSFASSRDISKAAYLPGHWPWMDGTIKALVKLGAITPDDAAAHMALCDRVVREREQQYHADTLARICADEGLPMSAEQKAFIARAARSEERRAGE